MIGICSSSLDAAFVYGKRLRCEAERGPNGNGSAGCSRYATRS